MSRAKMAEQERRLRSRLAQLVHERPMIRASLNPRLVTCGKQGCRCAKGDRHEALYLICSVEGKRRQLFVPHFLEQEVRQWVSNYHAAQDLIEQLSEGAWRQLKAKKEQDHS